MLRLSSAYGEMEYIMEHAPFGMRDIDWMVSSYDDSYDCVIRMKRIEAFHEKGLRKQSFSCIMFIYIV